MKKGENYIPNVTTTHQKSKKISRRESKEPEVSQIFIDIQISNAISINCDVHFLFFVFDENMNYWKGFNHRNLCGVESFCLSNPNLHICYHYYLKNSDIVEKIKKYYVNCEKLTFISFDVDEIFEFAPKPLYDYYHSNRLKESPFWNHELSDMIRLIILKIYGGLYLDLDSYVFKNISYVFTRDYDTLAEEPVGDFSIINTPMFFRKDSQLLNLIVDNFQEKVNDFDPLSSDMGQYWARFGPRLLSLTFSKLPEEDRVKKNERIKFIVEDIDFSMGSHWDHYHMLHQNANKNERYQGLIEKGSIFHLTHFFEDEFTNRRMEIRGFKLNENSAISDFERKFCPIIYENYLVPLMGIDYEEKLIEVDEFSEEEKKEFVDDDISECDIFYIWMETNGCLIEIDEDPSNLIGLKSCYINNEYFYFCGIESTSLSNPNLNICVFHSGVSGPVIERMKMFYSKNENVYFLYMNFEKFVKKGHFGNAWDEMDNIERSDLLRLIIFPLLRKGRGIYCDMDQAIMKNIEMFLDKGENYITSRDHQVDLSHNIWSGYIDKDWRINNSPLLLDSKTLSYRYIVYMLDKVIQTFVIEKREERFWGFQAIPLVRALENKKNTQHLWFNVTSEKFSMLHLTKQYVKYNGILDDCPEISVWNDAYFFHMFRYPMINLFDHCSKQKRHCTESCFNEMWKRICPHTQSSYYQKYKRFDPFKDKQGITPTENSEQILEFYDPSNVYDLNYKHEVDVPVSVVKLKKGLR